MTLLRVLALLLLLLTGGGAAPSAAACTPLARSAPTITRGIYIVQISLPASCRESVQVRLESYLGGTYPRAGWFTITRTEPLIRTGVPWYWRAARRMPSGATFPLVIPGMVRP